MPEGVGALSPEQAIRRLPALAGARVLRRLADSPVAATWLLASGDDDVVLKIDKPLAAQLGLDRCSEARLLRAFTRSGLAPVPLAADVNLLALRRLSGDSLRPASLAQGSCLAAIGRSLAGVHALPAAGVRELDYAASARRYAAVAGSPAAGRAAEALAELLRRLPRSGPTRVCHNDAHLGNWLRRPDGRLALVDWEYAGRGEPAFEIAVVAEWHGLGREALRALLAAYLASPAAAPLSLDQVEAWQAAYRQLEDLWRRALLVG